MRIAIPLAILLMSTSALFAKSSRTFYTDAEVQRALAKITQFDWAKNQLTAATAAADPWLAKSDQELWDFVPPPEQLRALNVCFGVDCPVHGAEIFRKGGHYPWITDPAHPFKVQCPVGGEMYPSNDFKPWNTEGLKGKPETGPGYVDKGLGWVNEKGQRFFFVGYYIFWQRWQKEVLPAVGVLARAYLLSGDPRYAHKCAILMSKIASEYERFDYPTQAYHNGAYPAGINGRILDYIWTTGTTSEMAVAYDEIFPALAKDVELAAFLKAKGLSDASPLIETKMLHVMANDIMRGFVRGNMGMHQQALATVAIVLDNDDPAKGPTKKQMTDWIMTGPGDSEYLLWNGFYRDGHGGESSPGYSNGWRVDYYNVLKYLPKLGVDIWTNPKAKKIADIAIDLTVAGDFIPSIGDSGSIQGSRAAGFWAPSVLAEAFKHYHDPRYAKALALSGAKTGSLFEDSIDDQVAAVVAKDGTDLGLRTRVLGGYGLGVLETGEGKDRRGVSMYYGHSGGGHGHRDRLTLEMFAYGRPMLTDIGYPAHWLEKNQYWTGNTVSHYAVVVDESGQRTMFPGQLNTLASCPSLQLMDASADKVAYPGITSLYRRTTALVDMSPSTSYLVDIFRVRGGAQHDYSFHGPPFPGFELKGASLGPAQAKGTLAGEDIPFGTKVPSARLKGGGQLVTFSRFEGLIPGAEPYDARSLKGWTRYTGESVLTRLSGAQITGNIPPIKAGKVKAILRAYDYAEGENDVDITIGGTTKTLRWKPDGQPGYRWYAEVFDLATDADTVKLTAGKCGQNYILLDGMVVTSDLTTTPEPSVSDPSDSGFQYLYNIRRAPGQRGFSATWSKPDEDLYLTMTMPADCAQEVICANAEPELQPGAPDKLDYVLASNVSADAKPLASTYIAIAEPHHGAAKVTAVERLSIAGKADGAAAVSVSRGAETDLIYSALDAAPSQCGASLGASRQFEVAAEFAAITRDAEGVKRACLVNATRLRTAGLSLDIAPPPTGTVTAVDHATNSVTLSLAVPNPAGLKGLTVIFGNDAHSTAYMIENANTTNGKTVLHLGDTLCLVGMGRITGTDDKAGSVTTDTTLTGYGRVDGGQHQGRWLYNEDKSQGFRIKSFNGAQFSLDGVKGSLDAVFTDKGKTGRRQFWLSDIGPGDTFRIPATTYIHRVRKGVYEVRMIGNVTVEVAS